MRRLVIIICFLPLAIINAQPGYWQQQVDYDMEIDFDVENYQFTGKQVLKYTNNSPDTLNRVFYHLYFNAFQPGSMMDVRARTIFDPDPRIGDKIYHLKEDEIGYHKINKLEQDGKGTKFEVTGSILEVELAHPILPHSSSVFTMEFKSQVPRQIIRNGRDNHEGISLSMAQWYPKMAEYDIKGWHANPYVGREFHGVWGDYKVKIKIDRQYTVAAGGLVKNPQKMGHGYSDKDTKKKKFLGKKKLTWEFVAENVHDFMWAADPDYTHFSKETDMGIVFHYFYQENEMTKDNWENLHRAMNEVVNYTDKHFGEYPYPVYCIIQGGDRGMEYPMGTLITGERPYSSLVGVSVHEYMHSYFHTLLATNESYYAWMDEGFTSFAAAEVMNHLKKMKLIPGKHENNPHYKDVIRFTNWALTGLDEPLTTHADHFVINEAYKLAAYGKGNVFLQQLEYIIGEKAFRSGLKRYYNEWKFKHPVPNDLIRIMEKESDIELDWYLDYWVNTTHTIDYAVNSVESKNGMTEINLSRLGYMPMPMDLEVKTKDGRTLNYNIPLRIMRGAKKNDSFDGMLAEDWPWTHPNYSLTINEKIKDIESVRLVTEGRIADTNINNNYWPKNESD